jgi:hypothetical protein
MPTFVIILCSRPSSFVSMGSDLLTDRMMMSAVGIPSSIWKTVEDIPLDGISSVGGPVCRAGRIVLLITVPGYYYKRNANWCIVVSNIYCAN